MTEAGTAGIEVIAISGPVKNYLNPEVMSGLVDRLESADRDRSVTGIVLTGEGEFFCGGLDVPTIQAGADPVEFARALAALLKVFPRLTTPIVAAVNGDAVASGASLAAACDYVVSVPSAKLGTYEVSVGVWPVIAQVPIIERIGPGWAMENIGSGEPFTVERACEVGLVNEVAESSALVETAAAWLVKAQRGGQATIAGRPSFYALAALPYDEAIDRSLDIFVAQFD